MVCDVIFESIECFLELVEGRRSEGVTVTWDVESRRKVPRWRVLIIHHLGIVCDNKSRQCLKSGNHRSGEDVCVCVCVMKVASVYYVD